MSGKSPASTAPFRIALACGLCLLAVVFSLEAKTAWYGPALGAGSAVRAAKALPADMLRAVEHGVPVPDPIHPALAFAVLTAFLSIRLADAPVCGELVRNLPSVARAAFFSPFIFFRPPPARS
ncbi:MAG TPA: hypothetical protein VGG26_10895 [Terracidiphilus sp.]|jgi:hypothetical protein